MPALRHRLNSVSKDVHEDLLNQLGIGFNHYVVASDFYLDPGAFGLRLDQFGGLLDERRQFDFSELEFVRARQVEQLPDDARDALGLVANDYQVALPRFDRGVGVMEQLFGAPVNNLQRRAHLVRHAGGQPPHGRELFAVPQLAFKRQPLFGLAQCGQSLFGQAVSHAVEFPRQAGQLAAARVRRRPVIQIAAPEGHGGVEQIMNGPRQVVARHRRHDQQDGAEQQQRRDQNVKAGARDVSLYERNGLHDLYRAHPPALNLKRYDH